MLERLRTIERTSIAAVTAILALNAVLCVVPAIQAVLGPRWQPISFGVTLAALLTLGALYASSSSPRMRPLGITLALALALGYGAVAVIDLLYGSTGNDSGALSGIAPQTASAYALLGCVLLFLRARMRLASIAADILMFVVMMLVLTITSAHVIGSFPFFGPASSPRTSLHSLLCLLLLTVVVFLRRVEIGFFSLLLGRGIASRWSRFLCPCLLAVPYLRETLRAHLFSTRQMPPNYVTATLASMAASVTLAIVFILGWRFNALEAQISDLSLRDPLTGLYNLRGFRLLAEQSLLLCRRSRQPFSVLFVDVDDLKHINDLHGHQTGSELLVETAQILKECFRETDVVGRIGGDEFAVAGHFSVRSMEHGAHRVNDSLATHNSRPERTAPLRFSVGHVTAEAGREDSLNALLAEADEAMYQEKRRRKAAIS